MSIRMTNHAQIRIKQRGIREETLSVIMEYGICKKTVMGSGNGNSVSSLLPLDHIFFHAF